MIRVLVLLSLFIAAMAEWDLVTERETKRSKQYCGEELSKALFFICGGRYNSPIDKKSFDDSSYPDYILDSLENESPEYKFPFQPIARALSALEYRRLKRGVHDECCKKSCSINEIKGYCLKRS